MSAPATHDLAGRDGLLRAVCAAPRDAWLRTVFADWVEEHHDEPTARAFRALLHVRVEPPTPLWWVASLGRFMVRRGRAFTEVPAGWRPLSWEPERVGANLLNEALVVEQGGFVEEVRCTAHNWLRRGAALVSLCPVVCVRLTDVRVAYQRRGPRGWWLSVPPAIDLLRRRPAQDRYESRAEALADLSQACVAYARRAAKLPPLPAPP